MLDILPRDIARTLPKIDVQILNKLGSAKGQFELDPTTRRGIVKISKSAFAGTIGEERRRGMRETLSHELMHWVHLESKGTKSDDYRRAIARHYVTRTKGNTILQDSHGHLYREDKWWDIYAGKEYSWETQPSGIEVPTRYFQLWENHDELMKQSSSVHNVDSDAFRETFALVHSIFDA